MTPDALRAEMDRRGVTQSELARISGVGRSNLNDYLNGKGDLYVRTYVRLWVALTGDEPTLLRTQRNTQPERPDSCG